MYVSDWNLLQIEELFIKLNFAPKYYSISIFQKGIGNFLTLYPSVHRKEEVVQSGCKEKQSKKFSHVMFWGNNFLRKKVQYFSFYAAPFFLLSTIILTSTFRANLLYIQTLSTYPTLEGKV